MYLVTASEYMKEKLTELDREIDNSTLIVGDFNIDLSALHRTDEQKNSVRTQMT